jgi:hypothetical protein
MYYLNSDSMNIATALKDGNGSSYSSVYHVMLMDNATGVTRQHRRMCRCCQ